jgi:hypothetical protein
MDFAPWGHKSDARYPNGTLCVLRWSAWLKKDAVFAPNGTLVFAASLFSVFLHLGFQ